MRLFALRGATSVDQNSADAIIGATEWLLREIMKHLKESKSAGTPRGYH